jgi:dTDP-4-amino-4,6-dideoxygalactose transaminase
MSELHAVLALASLEGLDDRIPARVATVELFEKTLGDDAGVRVVRPADGDVSTFKDLTFEITRDGASAAVLQGWLKEEGVDSRRYFWPPIHLQDAYRSTAAADLPVTDDLASRLLTVPMVTEDDDAVRLLAEVVARLVDRSAREA